MFILELQICWHIFINCALKPITHFYDHTLKYTRSSGYLPTWCTKEYIWAQIVHQFFYVLLKSENLKKNLKIWKYRNFPIKSQNMKNIEIENPTFFPTSKFQTKNASRKICLVKISWNIYFDHSFMSKICIYNFRSVAISFSWHRRNIIIFIMIHHSPADEPSFV